MSQNWLVVAIVGAAALCALVTGAVLLQTAAVVWQTSELSDLSDTIPGLMDQFVDIAVDAGFHDSVLRPDDPLLKDRSILLNHAVNARTARDIASRLIFLNSVDSSAPIDLYISTPGGWPDSAFTIIDAMRLIDAPVNTWAVGGCYSAGALILTSGTGRRFATDNAIIMIHANATDSLAPYSYDRLARVRYENAFRHASELPDAWYPMTADSAYYLNAEEALKFKLVDEVVATWAGDDE